MEVDPGGEPPPGGPGGGAAGGGEAANTDWWLWLMLSFFIFACIVVFIIIIFEDPEVRAYSRQHARRLSDWYNERYRQEEMIMLSQHRQQEPNPPLYQTIVPPTYQYQKPPTPIEPPPKYEESMGSGAGPPSPASGRFPVDPVESSSPSAETSDGQPEYSRRGKVKKTRVSPLLKQIKNLEGRKLLTSGHNIFVRKNDSTCDHANDSNDIVHQPDEALVYEFRAQPVNPFEVQ